MLTKDDLDQIRGVVHEEVTGVEKRLNGRMDGLELKIEAFHSEQKQANLEILGHLITSNEVNGNEQQALEKRVDRIETYLNLPPVK